VTNLIAIELAYVNTMHPDFDEAQLIHKAMNEPLPSVSQMQISMPGNDNGQIAELSKASWSGNVSAVDVDQRQVCDCPQNLIRFPFDIIRLYSVMIAQWGNISHRLLSGARVQFLAVAEYSKGFFPDWSHSANPS